MRAPHIQIRLLGDAGGSVVAPTSATAPRGGATRSSSRRRQPPARARRGVGARVAELMVGRPGAPARLGGAHDLTEVDGIRTMLRFHQAMLEAPGTLDASELSTAWVDGRWRVQRARTRWVRAALLAPVVVTVEGGGPHGR